MPFTGSTASYGEWLLTLLWTGCVPCPANKPEPCTVGGPTVRFVERHRSQSGAECAECHGFVTLTKGPGFG